MRLTAYALKRIFYRMKTCIDVLSALAEPTRLEAMRLLWDGREHCVCELMQQLGATQSRMSRHMATLKTAGLVVDRRDAQWVRYRRAPDLPAGVVGLIDAALALPGERERRAA
jgi:ArsR family transcriptional regulator, arsenate/arsenite/antimonite-responsive transcriptional repressor